ncbi:MAG: hypothetical protein JWO37_1515 [Acidimicrobiales bacterium]|jgi:hypothetical protein|nr:hypothetical protein [Acidimicrobiales bacterium]
MRRTKPDRDERGSVLVISALAMVALVTVCALVIDTSVLRSDRRVDRGAADAAATAAALDLDGSSSATSNACADAWNVALQNLRLNGSGVTSPCGAAFPAGTACSVAAPVQAAGTVSGVTIRITIPVVDGAALMSATAIGGNVSQAGNALDGTACQRVGVEIQRSRTSVFGRAAGSSGQSTTVHSVARYNTSPGNVTNIPALVALNKTACPSVDASSGIIHVYSNGAYPGIIDNDSVASAASCSSSTTDNAGSSGSIITDTSLISGKVGVLGYSAPTQTKAFSASGTYVGSPTYEPPITRTYVDTAYHCGNVSPLPTGCTTGLAGNDAISAIQARYGQTAAGAPSGFTTFPNPALGQSCNTIPALFVSGNWYINCPTFTVGSTVTFTSGDIIFAGNIALGAHATLNINAANSSDTTVVVQGTTGISTSSNTWLLNWYRTTVVMTNTACQTTISSCGTMTIQNGGGVWTAPLASATKGLIYWTETSQTTSFQGNPLLTWQGVFFAGSSVFDLQGNAVVDASNVQLWVDSATLHNSSARLYLKPDPATGRSTQRAGSSLIR